MKKVLFFLAALSALTLFSCEKGQDVNRGDGKKVDVTISIQGTPDATKATGTTYADESRVNSLQVFVFNGEALEDYKSADNAMSVIISATSGVRTIYAIVTAPALYETLGGANMTLTALTAATSRLADNALYSFIMTGSVTQELVDGGTIPVEVRRIVSRVSIGKISTAFRESRANYTVDLLGIYMINVCGDTGYGIDSGSTEFINMQGHTDGVYDVFLCDMINGVTISNDSPYVTEHAFYPYPNAYPNNHDDAWSARNSMLVIEVNMNTNDGTGQVIHGYYPIDLPGLERNKTYVIDEVQLTRLPGEVPYKPIETGESTVTISVKEWEVGLNLGSIVI